jgi:hypothetical protein
MISARARLLLLIAVITLAVAAVGPVAIAMADPPTVAPDVQITSPLNGTTINSPSPVFRGTTDSIFDEYEFEEFELEELPVEYRVTLKIYAGDSVAGTPLEKLSTPYFQGGTWSIGLAEALAPGTYTARAEQSDGAPERGRSAPVSFTVDTTPPQVTLSSPANGSSTSSGSQLVAGTAGSAPGDASAITINLFVGGTINAAALETLVVQASSGSWSATFGGLAVGTYTAQAVQRDQAGNTGTSAPVIFTVDAPSARPPPVASFKWFPQAPKTGESVSLVSSSTGSASPITAFAWALSSNGAFSAGKPVLSTSFATPGRHVVRLRVTDADGRSSVATETVPVTARPRILMQPFPIVRIAGSVTADGARIKLLTVQAPVAARVTVTCRGRGCKTKSESRLATVSSKTKSKAGAVLLSFHRFERPLRAGVILTILVSKPGQIGKYTSFVIRRHRAPARTDACLSSTRSKPIACTPK